MLIFPAIDLVGGQAVRLYKGDYERMTVYNPDPVAVAQDFAAAGSGQVHIVDLEGARDGGTPNLDTVCRIVSATGMFVEVGGGIRSMETADRYLSSGVNRVILGTAAVTDEAFLRSALREFGAAVAVGVDIRDGFVAVKGWTEKTALRCEDFFARLQDLGVQTVICTDISRDGAMLGTNRELYKALSARFGMALIASGGVSALEDVTALRDMGLAGAIIGKAYYTGAIDLAKAIEAAK
ncbi:MAG: 1-(5-phosphoribosyl)-5-[(5-phosphoribosylamino)methylideneamino]imidazole-4-carboxamide isomerase [Oscillospiraceae bacterium]|nr:1-(5-phosphoribosyl)-5-[(5-phosphoribosylamino)methylideneamino]imidazole-4-carboxamide isomerase [Oscillospiraceae bacterium]